MSKQEKAYSEANAILVQENAQVASFQSKKIMIIEDDQTMVDLYERVLVKHGHQIVAVSGDVNDAVHSFEIHSQGSQKPDVIIADNRLPDGFGLDAIVRMLQVDPGLNVILASADSVTEEIARKAGVRTLLKKPFAISQLILAVSAIEKSKVKVSGSD